MNPLEHCLTYPMIKKLLAAFGNPMGFSVMIVGDPNHPENIKKQKWFDDWVEFDKKRREFLGWDKKK